MPGPKISNSPRDEYEWQTRITGVDKDGVATARYVSRQPQSLFSDTN